MKFVSFAVLVVALTGQAHAQDMAALMERLHRATALNSIDDPQLKPWHLKLSFQLFDAKGSPTETGTIEEWWSGPSTHRTVYTSPSYTSTEIQTDHGLYRSKGVAGAPEVLKLMLTQAVHPTPQERDFEFAKPFMQKHSFGKTEMDCVALEPSKNQEITQPLGMVPTYCFENGQDLLRLSFPFFPQATVRNHIGGFQGRDVVVDQIMSQGAVKTATVHLETLETIKVSDTDFAPSAELESVSDPLVVSSATLQSLMIKSVPPIYPPTAKNNRISGSVVLSVIIGRDGRVQSSKVLSAPSDDLSEAAVTSIRQWTYKPYLVNGNPAEITSIVTINFAISR
jgi:TonB family protein